MKRLESGNIFCHGSVMMRLRALRDVNFYREEFPVTQDYDLWLRITERHQIASLPEFLYQFRFNSESVSRKKRALQLAYRRLAHDLCEQRKAQGFEDPIPEDVMLAYPPERKRLFRDARGNAYLLYISGERSLAAGALVRAQEFAKGEKGLARDWCEWLLGRAIRLSELRRDFVEGAEFIRWFFEELTSHFNPEHESRILGRYYADRAFSEWSQEHPFQRASLAVMAVRHDRRWLKNRGLWAIAFKSLLPE